MGKRKKKKRDEEEKKKKKKKEKKKEGEEKERGKIELGMARMIVWGIGRKRREGGKKRGREWVRIGGRRRGMKARVIRRRVIILVRRRVRRIETIGVRVVRILMIVNLRRGRRVRRRRSRRGRGD